MNKIRSSSAACIKARGNSLEKKQNDLQFKISSLKKNKETMNKTQKSITHNLTNKLPPSANNSFLYYKTLNNQDQLNDQSQNLNINSQKVHDKSSLYTHNTKQLNNLLFQTNINNDDENNNQNNNILQELNENTSILKSENQTPKITKIKKQIFGENYSLLKSNNNDNNYNYSQKSYNNSNFNSKSKIKKQKLQYQRSNNFDQENINPNNYQNEQIFENSDNGEDQEKENWKNQLTSINKEKYNNIQKKQKQKSYSHDKFNNQQFSIYSLASCGLHQNTQDTKISCEDCDNHQEQLQYMQQQLQIAKRQWLLIHHKKEHEENKNFMKIKPLEQSCKLKYQEYLNNRKPSNKLKKLIQNHKHTVIHKLY